MGKYQRDQAWTIEPYPCIGGFAFLLLSLTRHPQYAAVLERLKYSQISSNASADYRQERLLDLGCCMGQDLRKLAFDGVPVTSLHGADLRPDLMAVGFDLFRDRNRWSQLPDAFFELDVLDPVLPTSLSGLNIRHGNRPLAKHTCSTGIFTVVHIAMVLHLFGRPQQVIACTNIVTKLLSSAPGSIIIGSQVGTVDPRAVASQRHVDKELFLHNEETFRQLWEEVGQKTKTEWQIDTALTTPWKQETPGKQDPPQKRQPLYFDGGDTRWLTFTVTRLG